MQKHIIGSSQKVSVVHQCDRSLLMHRSHERLTDLNMSGCAHQAAPSIGRRHAGALSFMQHEIMFRCSVQARN